MELYAKRKYIIVFMAFFIIFMYGLLWFVPENKDLFLAVELVPPAISCFLLALASRYAQGTDKWFWFILAVGSGLYLAGQLIWGWIGWTRSDQSLPTGADVFWHLKVVCIFTAFLYQLVKKRSVFQGMRFIFNTVIMSLIAGILGWAYLVEPNLTILIETNSLFRVVTALAYPITDLGIFLCLMIVFFAYKELFGKSVILFFTSGLFLFIVTNSFYFILVVVKRYETGSWIDPLWSVSLFLLGLSGLYSFCGTATPSVKPIRPFNWCRLMRLVVPYASISVLFLFMLKEIPDLNGIVLGTTAVLVLILARQIIVLLENENLVRHLKNALVRISYQADHDELSSLPNRRWFERNLDEALREAQGAGEMVGVLFTDLDRFKYINDSLGHGTGDALVRLVAARLREVLGTGYKIARLGGDEFAVLLTNMADTDEPKRIAERIIESFVHSFQAGIHDIQMTTSIGIAMYPRDGQSFSELMKNTDAAMYKAKEEGRNRYVFYSCELNQEINRKLSMEQALRKALDTEQLILHYQPQIDIATQRIAGAEALLRWKLPNGTMVPPAQFIPLAEETGVIVPLGEWVIRQACRQAKLREQSGEDPLLISVNVSPRQLQQDNFVEKVKEILKETGFEPARLVMEVTEGIAMENSAETVKKLTALKSLGIHISMDDFGTGYASIGYLQTYQVSSLKIAQSFVSRLTEAGGEQANVVKAIMSVARIFGLKVIVEGVETREQYDFFKKCSNCWIQGYYFYKPVAMQDFPSMPLAPFASP